MASHAEFARPPVDGGCRGATFEARLVRTPGNGVTVVIAGEIDLATEGHLWSVLEHAISLGPPVVLDFGGTTFIGAAGLTLIVRAHRQLGGRRTALVVRSLGANARKLFTLTGIDQLVTVEEMPGDEH